jgi:hypothetical protein
VNYKVVKIVNEYLIVINYGLKDLASIGDSLEIFQIGEEVYDPETNDALGTLDISKGRVRVKNVYENMSLCESDEYHKIISPGMNTFSQALSNLSSSFSTIETKALEVNTNHISGGYNEGDKGLINLLDPVRIIKAKYLDQIENEENDSEE